MSLGLASQECDVFHQRQFINIQSKGACQDSYMKFCWSIESRTGLGIFCHTPMNFVMLAKMKYRTISWIKQSTAIFYCAPRHAVDRTNQNISYLQLRSNHYLCYNP